VQEEKRLWRSQEKSFFTTAQSVSQWWKGRLSASINPSASKGCQSRHLARIFTVDIQQLRELNSLRRVSQLNVSEFKGAACRACWVLR